MLYPPPYSQLSSKAHFFNELLSKSIKFSSIAHIYALEMDRQLRAIGEPPITFAAHTLGRSQIFTDCKPVLDGFFAEMNISECNNPICDAEVLANQGRRSEAIQFAFSNFKSLQINALNVFYANHASFSPEIRTYFLNKYFSSFGLKISLDRNKYESFFSRILCEGASEKIYGPLVTVIMSTYNAEATIDFSVESLLNQSWRNLQIIIVDDASTDDTLQKLRALAIRDPRIEVLSNSVSAGVYICRNLGLSKARGKWLAIHEADNWAFPGRIERQIKELTSNNGDACIVSLLRMNAKGKIVLQSVEGRASGDVYQSLHEASLVVDLAVFRAKVPPWHPFHFSDDVDLSALLKSLEVKTINLQCPLLLNLNNDEAFISYPELGVRAEMDGGRRFKSIYQLEKKNQHKSVGSYAKEGMSSTLEDAQINQPVVEAGITPEEKRPAPLSIINTQISNHGRILMEANKIAKAGDHPGAIAWALMHSSPEMLYTLQLLEANASVAEGKYSAWLKHINAYLKIFNVGPISLSGGAGSFFERIYCLKGEAISDGPLISVIMPAWNVEKTVRKSVDSILNQTWKNLELLIVDDCSTDNTWSIIREIARTDCRVKIIRNKINVGPYVSKNIAFLKAKGEWVTGQDADDWSFPERIEVHMANVIRTSARASVTYMLRQSPDGICEHFTPIGQLSFDGVARLAPISAMLNVAWMRDKLGFWDSVRFGADSELISRARKILGEEFKEFQTIGMICLDLPGSLTNDLVTGIRTASGLSTARKDYKRAWQEMHKGADDNTLKLAFPAMTSPYLDDYPYFVSLESLHSVESDELGLLNQSEAP